MSLHGNICVTSERDCERVLAADAERHRVFLEQRPAARAALLNNLTVLYAALEAGDVTKRMHAALVAGDDTECGRIVRAHFEQHVDSLLEDVEYGINPTSATPDELVREWGAE